MNKVLSISDTNGAVYIDSTLKMWNDAGFTVESKDFSTTLEDDHFDQYSLIIFTMNHENNKLYKEYGKSLKRLSDIPIVCFPYGDNFPSNDKVQFVNGDADEIISLPTDMDVAIANCVALVRMFKTHTHKNIPSTIIFEGNITLNMSRYTAIVDGKEISLSKIECHILFLLMQHPNQILTYQQIFRFVWGDEYIDNPKSILWNHVRNLRLKLKWHPGLPDLIHNKRGIGYSFTPN